MDVVNLATFEVNDKDERPEYCKISAVAFFY